VQIVVWFCETKSVTQTQRNFRTHYQKDPPSRNSIIDWKKKCLETGSVRVSVYCNNPAIRRYMVCHADRVLKYTINLRSGPEIGISSINWAQLSMFYLKTETESSPKLCVLKNKQEGFR
jgi:hypothetical protein